LNRGRPLSALGRFAAWQIASRLRPEIEFEWIEGAKLIVRRGTTGVTGNIYCGLHEFIEMGCLVHLLRPDDLFLDLGANIGSYTVLAAGVCRARAIDIPDAAAPTLIELDVEGFAEKVLSGASLVLASSSLLAVQSELCSPMVQHTLQSFGFERQYYNPFTRTLWPAGAVLVIGPLTRFSLAVRLRWRNGFSKPFAHCR
jgi:hypothetical protein